MRRKGEPCLKDQRNDAGPVEYKIGRKVVLHVIKPDVIYNEWECVHECKHEKRIGNPSVKDLESLVRNSRKQCDPIRFACGCAGYY